jgi:hypothetical protein
LDVGTAGSSPAAASKRTPNSKWRLPERAHHSRRSLNGGLEWNGCFLLRSRYTPANGFGNSTHGLS